jgi:uncharacterized protein
MKKISISLIKFYKNFVSFLLETLFGKGCRFYPTCSDYAKEAIGKYGFQKGSTMSLKRLSKCHPFNKGGVDFVN